MTRPAAGGEAGQERGRVVRKAASAWDRGNAIYGRGVDWVDRQEPSSRKGATIGWFRRYREADGQLYALLIAAYSLLTFVPAAIAVGTYAEPKPGSLSNSVVDRLHLTGSTAALFRDVLTNADTKKLGATLLALANLLLFGLGFGRALQLAHAKAWGIDLKQSAVVDQLRYVIALLATTCVLLLIAGESAAIHNESWWIRLALAPLWILLAAILFTFLPYMLLHRRISIRSLYPGAVLVALGLVGLRLISSIVLVNWLKWYGKYYGGFGIVMALFFWIMIAATIMVVAAALSPALAARRDALEARLATT